MTSLHHRLTLWFTTLLVLMSLLAGAGAYLIAWQDPDSFLDDQLKQIALNVGETGSAANEAVRAALDPIDVIGVQVWDAAGHLVKATPPGIALPRQGVTGFSNLSSEHEHWRTYTLVGPVWTVQVSQRTAVLQEAALNAALVSIAPVLLLIPLSWLLVRWLVHRILRPLDELAGQLESREPDTREPLVVSGVPDEVAPLVTATNAALARVTEALADQRRFVSDAAHQLRTPLTALRLQVGNLKRVSGARASDLLKDVEEALKRMSVLTAQLLTLARAETHAVAGTPGRTSLAAALKEAIASTAPLARAKEIAVAFTSCDQSEVAASSHDLATLFTNLIDNAVRYTPRGGRVDVRVQSAGGVVAAEVCDTGPGLPEDQLSSVFDRFTRYAHDGEGTGLGLAIVRALAEQIDARVSLHNCRDATGLVARVELKPASQPTPPPQGTQEL